MGTKDGLSACRFVLFGIYYTVLCNVVGHGKKMCSGQYVGINLINFITHQCQGTEEISYC